MHSNHACVPYCGYSRLGPSNLSDTEKAVHDQLASLGITEEMLREDLNKGVRSPIIGTYRILLHKHMMKSEDKRADYLKLDKIGTIDGKITQNVGKIQNLKSTKIKGSKTCVLL